MFMISIDWFKFDSALCYQVISLFTGIHFVIYISDVCILKKKKRLFPQPRTVNLDLSAKILIGDAHLDRLENSKFKSEWGLELVAFSVDILWICCDKLHNDLGGGGGGVNIKKFWCNIDVYYMQMSFIVLFSLSLMHCWLFLLGGGGVMSFALLVYIYFIQKNFFFFFLTTAIYQHLSCVYDESCCCRPDLAPS